MILVCGIMALRQGEAIALHPSDIDWKQRRIWVHLHVDKETGRREEGTKQDGGSGSPCPTWSLTRFELKSPSTHLMSGCSTHRQAVHREPRRQGVARGVQARRHLRCPLHDLRHAAASLMISAGWNVKRIQTEMRHADPGFTLRVYGHLFPQDADRDRKQLDQALSAALGDTAGLRAQT